MVAYPERWSADVVLSDGGTVHLRPIRPEDAPRILALHGRMSERTRYFRYFSPYPRMPERDLRRFVEVDHERRVALVAELAGELIAVGRFDRIGDSTDAEVAFVVEDAHQGRGIGSVLLEHLAAIARELGLVRFVAEVLPENTQMIKVFADAGYAAERRYDSGVVHLTFPVAETGTSVRVRWAREQRAEAASIARLLRPGSVAVIGASTDPDSIGQALLRHLGDFPGPVYPVHPRAVEVAGRPAYPSVGEIPGPVDLAVVAVPAHAVPRVIAECAEKGVHAAVVISAGFAETGPEGQRAERDLVRAARRGGMRIVGPNAFGVINTATGLNASLVPFLPERGRVGFFCQSGALGVAVLEQVVLRGLGLSAFVSAGNRADVSGNDLLQYWASDPETDVVLLYLETFGNPRKFGRLARRLARSRPVVVVKGGRSGTVAPGLAGKATPLPEEHVEALFAASGVIRVDTVSELFDAGQLLAYQPLPAGGRVAVVGNSAALALLTEEACVAAGLAVTRRVDIGPTAGPGALASAVREVLADREVDALVVVFVPVPQRDGGPYADALAAAVSGAGKPVVSTFLAIEGVPERLRRVSLPSYPSPEVAVRALARVAAYAEWRRRPPGDVPELPGLRPEAATVLIADTLAAHPTGTDLAAPDVASLLDAYGIAITPDDDPPGVPVRIELRWDPSFGAIIGYGLAGVATALFDDWAYRPVPLTDVDAAALIRVPKAASLLLDHDLDVEALEDLLLRVSRLADDHPEVAGLTLDPLIVTPDGCTLRAAATHLTPATRPDTGPRRL